MCSIHVYIYLFVSLQIPEARHLLSRSIELLSTLRASHGYMTSLPTGNVASWNIAMEQVNKSKVGPGWELCTFTYCGPSQLLSQTEW